MRLLAIIFNSERHLKSQRIQLPRKIKKLRLFHSPSENSDLRDGDESPPSSIQEGVVYGRLGGDGVVVVSFGPRGSPRSNDWIRTG